jgi:hypothetical protein
MVAYPWPTDQNECDERPQWLQIGSGIVAGAAGGDPVAAAALPSCRRGSGGDGETA